jgi:hypothetical protein
MEQKRKIQFQSGTVIQVHNVGPKPKLDKKPNLNNMKSTRTK